LLLSSEFSLRANGKQTLKVSLDTGYIAQQGPICPLLVNICSLVSR